MKVISKCYKQLYWFMLKSLYSLMYLIAKQKNIVAVFSTQSYAYKNIPIVVSALKQQPLKNTDDNEIQVVSIMPTEANIRAVLQIAKAKVLLLDATTPLLAKLKIYTNTVCIQLWHSGGLYKKVGFDATRSGYDYNEEMKRITRIHRNINYFIISDAKLIDDYAHMFHLPHDHILPFGLVRTDELVHSNSATQRQRILNDFYSLFPQAKGKKILTYAPTFRSGGKNRYFKSSLDYSKLQQAIGDSWFVCIRKHPSLTISNQPAIESADSSWHNVSAVDATVLLTVTDILISDYSSIIFDFSLLNKPVVIVESDLNDYQNERGLYLSPTELVGKDFVINNTEELVSLLQKISKPDGNDDGNQFSKFNQIAVQQNIAKRFMSACDGKATQRVFGLVKDICC